MLATPSFTPRRTSTFTLPSTTLYEEQLEPLVRGTLAGEPRAWGKFWLAVDPTIERIAGRWRVTSRLAERADDRRDVVTLVMGRFREDEFSRLRAFHDVLLRRDGSFLSWLSVMTRRTALNHVDAHPEYLGEGATDAERRWIDLLPLPKGFERSTPVSSSAAVLAEAGMIQSYVEANLPPAQQKALHLWLIGHSNAEIAAALGLAAEKHADLLVRATLNHLRRRYDRPSK